MVQYTLAQSPETILTVPGKDSPKARDKAMDQLIEKMEAGELPTVLSDGFSPSQFIEIKDLKDSSTTPTGGEDPITQAVQVLSNLATLKQKVQASRAEAISIRQQLDVLFTDEEMDEEELAALKEGFKTLKSFAQLATKYLEARAQAEQARAVIDRTLKSVDQALKSESDSPKRK